jgi:alkylhydroperoxidase family enzyme
MARVKMVNAADRPELKDAISKVTGARQGRLINVYGLLLNSPGVASAWVDLINAVRHDTELDARTRELVTIRVAVLNKTDYIFRAHVPAYVKEAGLTEAELDALRSTEPSDVFGERDKATIALVDTMTRDIDVPDSIFAAAARHYSERQLVELAVLVGVYNMHGRVMRALKIDPEPSWDLSIPAWK